MNAVQRYAPLIGRILLSLIFLLSGLMKIPGWGDTAAYMAARGMPAAPVFLALAIALEMGGGLSVLAGYKARLGAAALIVFTIPTLWIFHNFWAYPLAEQQVQMVMFLKNLAIIGGLLLLAAFGPGPFSYDQRRGV